MYAITKKDQKGSRRHAEQSVKKSIFTKILFMVLVQVTGADFCSHRGIGVARVRLANSM